MKAFNLGDIVKKKFLYGAQCSILSNYMLYKFGRVWMGRTMHDIARWQVSKWGRISILIDEIRVYPPTDSFVFKDNHYNLIACIGGVSAMKLWQNKQNLIFIAKLISLCWPHRGLRNSKTYYWPLITFN